MKIRHIIATTVWGMGILLFSGCSEDEIDHDNLVTKVSETQQSTPFDTWLKTNFLEPYNIQLQYRLNNNELSPETFITPVRYEQAIRFAHLTKYACLEAYDEVTGSQEFVRSLFPKLLQVGGSHLYNPDGTIDQGAAEGGRKISIYGLNDINLDVFDQIVEIFHTMHHEFAHIQNQTKNFSQEYRAITPTLYQGSLWSTYWAEVEGSGNVDVVMRNEIINSSSAIKEFIEKLTVLSREEESLRTELTQLENDPWADSNDIEAKRTELAAKSAELKALQDAFGKTEDGFLWRRVNSLIAYYLNKNGYLDLNALRAGFVSAYSSASPDEDFVEVQATYIMETPHTWETLLILAGPGAEAIKQKLAMVRAYLQTEWNIDLDKLRDAVQRRHASVPDIDLNKFVITNKAN